MEKDFWHVGQILMDNHKLVMISISGFFKKKHGKDANFFMKICLENF